MGKRFYKVTSNGFIYAIGTDIERLRKVAKERNFKIEEISERQLYWCSMGLRSEQIYG